MKEAQALLRDDLRAALARRSLLGSRKKARAAHEAAVAAGRLPDGKLEAIDAADRAVRLLRGKLAVHKLVV